MTHLAADLLHRRAVGALSDDERASVEAHLASCAACATRGRAMVEIASTLRAVSASSPTAGELGAARARLRRALDAERAVQLRAWRPRTVFAAVVVATFTGAAVAATVGVVSRRAEVRASSPSPTTAVIAPPAARVAPLVDDVARAPLAPPARVAEAPPRIALAPPSTLGRPSSAPSAPAAPAPAVSRAVGTPSPVDAYLAFSDELAAEPPGDPRFVALGDLAALAGRPRDALLAYVRALAGARGSLADERIDALVADGVVAERDVLAAIEGDSVVHDSAEGLRRRCSARLRVDGDRAAVDVCRAFGQRFPEHPAVRRLALAAGRTAEFRLDDVELAVEEYSRAILVSDVAGVSSTEALLARARARTKLGQREEARSDLRLYLHVHPEARFRDEVAALARLLDVASAP